MIPILTGNTFLRKKYPDVSQLLRDDFTQYKKIQQARLDPNISKNKYSLLKKKYLEILMENKKLKHILKQILSKDKSNLLPNSSKNSSPKNKKTEEPRDN